MRIALAIVLTIFGLKLQAQKKIITCEAIHPDYCIELYKVNNQSQLNNYKLMYPVYLVDTTNYKILNKTHLLIASQQDEIKSLKTNLLYYKQLVNEHDTLLTLQEKRVEMYQKSYLQVADINKQLSDHFDKMYDLSLRQAKKTSTNSITIGILAGLVIVSSILLID